MDNTPTSFLLPVPNQEEVIRFQELHTRLYGIELSRKEAQKTLTDLVQFYFLIGAHEVKSLRRKRKAK